jgi:hypothetical protein
MARRQIEQELADSLKLSEFNFIPRGTIDIQTVYELVHQTFPTLCDDTFLCSDHCIDGGNQPEWMHVVRGVLDGFNKQNGPITKNPQRNYWDFQ